ncbi:MAG: acyl-CoA dehydrogenase family protein [Myxococcota bacterium]|nr:acyl-CoA dehydrogenase family protein [Myxococcota bacterium]
MNLELTEDQKMIQESIRRFAESEVKPRAAELDEKCEFPWSAVKGLSELGMMGMFVETEYGGSGLDYVSGTIAIEEIARYDASLALTLASHNSLCIGHIRVAGSEEQKKKWLPDLAAGKKLGAWGLTEPNSGSDASGMLTTAVKDGDSWVINGSKIFITQGTVGDVFVVLAKTDGDRAQHGISAFILEKGMKGFTQKAMHGKLGMRASDTAELYMENVIVPAENLLGNLNEGFIDTLQVLDAGRIGIGALAVGIGRGALEESRNYALDRKQFGKPIGDFQAIQWMLADIATEIDAARLMVRRAAWTGDHGLPLTLASSQAKLFASEAATRAAMKAIQIHGGYGYTREFPVERYLRDAKLLEIGEGTSEVQRLVIARRILSS